MASGADFEFTLRSKIAVVSLQSRIYMEITESLIIDICQIIDQQILAHF